MAKYASSTMTEVQTSTKPSTDPEPGYANSHVQSSGKSCMQRKSREQQAQEMQRVESAFRNRNGTRHAEGGLLSVCTQHPPADRAGHLHELPSTRMRPWDTCHRNKTCPRAHSCLSVGSPLSSPEILGVSRVAHTTVLAKCTHSRGPADPGPSL